MQPWKDKPSKREPRKGLCRDCGVMAKIGRAGRFAKHAAGIVTKRWCEGSGKPAGIAPAKVTVTLHQKDPGPTPGTVEATSYARVPGPDGLRTALIRLLWCSVADHDDHDASCTAGDPAPLCEAWRALKFGDHWPGYKHAEVRLAASDALRF